MFGSRCGSSTCSNTHSTMTDTTTGRQHNTLTYIPGHLDNDFLVSIRTICSYIYIHACVKTYVHRVVFQLEDCALQLYKYVGNSGDYGSYLDLESSLEEQWEELEGFTEE